MEQWILQNWSIVAVLYLFIAMTFGRMYAVVSCEVLDAGINDHTEHLLIFPFTAAFQRGKPFLAFFAGDRARRAYLWIASLGWIFKVLAMFMSLAIVAIFFLGLVLAFFLLGFVVGTTTLFWRGFWTEGLSRLIDMIPVSERRLDQV